MAVNCELVLHMKYSLALLSASRVHGPHNIHSSLKLGFGDQKNKNLRWVLTYPINSIRMNVLNHKFNPSNSKINNKKVEMLVYRLQA